MGKWDRTSGVYDRLYKNSLFNMIDMVGRTVDVFYRTSTACNYCGWDPVNEESTNANCSTCDGFGRIYSEEKISIKGVVNKFVGNLKYVREGNNLYQVQPEGDIRITFKLQDTLVNPRVSTSSTIFKDCQKVYVDGENYKVRDWKRFGVKRLHIIEITGERIKEETT